MLLYIVNTMLAYIRLLLGSIFDVIVSVFHLLSVLQEVLEFPVVLQLGQKVVGRLFVLPVSGGGEKENVDMEAKSSIGA